MEEEERGMLKRMEEKDEDRRGGMRMTSGKKKEGEKLVQAESCLE